RVTTARVRPMTRCPRSAGSACGSAVTAFICSSLRVNWTPRAAVASPAERVGVAGKRRHDRHHELLPGRGERPLPVAGGPRQGAEIEGDVAAFLRVEAALGAQRHVA